MDPADPDGAKSGPGPVVLPRVHDCHVAVASFRSRAPLGWSVTLLGHMRRLDTPYIRRRVAQRATVVKPHPAAEQVSPVGYHPGARFQAVSVYVLPYPTYGHSATLPIYPCHISLIYIRQGNGNAGEWPCNNFFLQPVLVALQKKENFRKMQRGIFRNKFLGTNVLSYLSISNTCK